MSHDTSWQYLVSMPSQKGVVQECVAHLWFFFKECVAQVLRNDEPQNRFGIQLVMCIRVWGRWGFRLYISIGERCRCFFLFTPYFLHGMLWWLWLRWPRIEFEWYPLWHVWARSHLRRSRLSLRGQPYSGFTTCFTLAPFCTRSPCSSRVNQEIFARKHRCAVGPGSAKKYPLNLRITRLWSAKVCHFYRQDRIQRSW